MNGLKVAFQLAIMFLPWRVRRWLLARAMHYEIHPTAHIGKSIVLVRRLFMGEGSRIGSLNFCRGLVEIRLEPHATIGNLNWISGFPLEVRGFFASFPDRSPQLHLKEHAIIVHRNLIDCTDRITIGRFALVAGNRGQLLTHGIDLRTSSQSCAPVDIGDYCMVGSGCILLKGSALPEFSVLGAGSTLHKRQTESHTLYSGVPAQAVRKLDTQSQYFMRDKGAIN